MAATVFTGSGNWSYTNSTGGNVRVIIAYCNVSTAAQTTDVGVKQIVNGTEIGSATSGTNMYFRGFGKHINYIATRNSPKILCILGIFHALLQNNAFKSKTI